MDQFDKAFKNINQCENEVGSTNILILGTATNSIDAIRASLEVHGHTVTQTNSVTSYEELSCDVTYDVLFVSVDTDTISTEEVFESVSLIHPGAIVIGYSEEPSHNTVIQFIREGGSDFLCVPSDLNVTGERVQTLLKKQVLQEESKEQTTRALRLCDKINDERHRVEEENDVLNTELANAHCSTKKKMQQVAIGAEFQTLVSQELDVESMLRTALGYMLTRIGSMNAAVYLREGAIDWGIGAYINYDRQPEQFQSLIDELGPAVCPIISGEEAIKHTPSGESFANSMGLDIVDFSGSEVVTYGCYSGDRCMAVVVLFRDESRSFNKEAIDTIETIRTIFGYQLGTILKIHRRAESQWPSESIDDDDWSIGKAA
jgi:DNA-binding response OmpR family regulator